MIALSKAPSIDDTTQEEFRKNIAGLHQIKAFSRWLGLSASLQSSTSGEAQFLKKWAALENCHAELLLDHTSGHEGDQRTLQQTPLRLAQDILQQDSGGTLSTLFFHSLIALKQWETEQSEKFQQQAIAYSEHALLPILKKLQREDQAMAQDVIAFCNRNKKQLHDDNPHRRLEIA